MLDALLIVNGFKSLGLLPRKREEDKIFYVLMANVLTDKQIRCDYPGIVKESKF